MRGLGEGPLIDCNGTGSGFLIEAVDANALRQSVIASVVVENVHVRNAASADNAAGEIAVLLNQR